MSIKANFAKSGMWMVTGAIFNNLSSTAIFIVLARLLTPVQFGIVAFATIFIDLSRVLVVAGIPDALIQRKEWDDKVASSAFWTNIAIASLICALIGGIATPISYFVYDATFALVLLALSLALFVEAITAVHTAKLRREFRYKAIASRNMAANVLGGAIGIALAWIGWGVWALVVSRLLSASITHHLVAHLGLAAAAVFPLVGRSQPQRHVESPARQPIDRASQFADRRAGDRRGDRACRTGPVPGRHPGAQFDGATHYHAIAGRCDVSLLAVGG